MDVDPELDDNASDPVTVEIRGPEVVAFDVAIHMWSAETASARAEIYLDPYLLSYSTRDTPVIMSLLCEPGVVAHTVDVFEPLSRGVVDVVSPVATPGDLDCVVAFAPAAELFSPLTLEWTASAEVESLSGDGDTYVAVSIDVTVLGDGLPRRTSG